MENALDLMLAGGAYVPGPYAAAATPAYEIRDSPLRCPSARLRSSKKARKSPKIIFYGSVTVGQTRSVPAPRGNLFLQVARNKDGSGGGDAHVTPWSQNLPSAGSIPVRLRPRVIYGRTTGLARCARVDVKR